MYFECDFCTFVFWYRKFETQICISKYTCVFKIHMCISKATLYNLPSDEAHHGARHVESRRHDTHLAARLIDTGFSL